MILSTGSGPGGRRFKSFRPDHLLSNQYFTGTQIVADAWSRARRSAVQIESLRLALERPNLYPFSKRSIIKNAGKIFAQSKGSH